MDDENYFAEEDADDDGGDSDFENFPPSLPSITRSETSAAPPTWTGGRREGLPTAQAALGKKSALGPYVLLKTIGEGEFGKVKLAYHIDNPSKQVAVKLILKENIRNPTKHAKVLREISILQTLSHPFIVKLHEVVETDQYIGMVMEYASGGELFEYILAHRYLKEKDACRFFAQLLAGVRYIHSVGIVHRDLKLENLLLDGNHNVIITDFGFANRFRSGDVDIFMQTSCGSPCYAAPELVISEGYAGEAADVWSCGVILYAMLSGFLPFDDDPENPDGDNINQLYKYILETSLEFPEHISSDAQSLLKRMLVPDPRHRAKLSEVISHKFGFHFIAVPNLTYF
ncbi:kinase-like domain-containing protein [Zopfochytrium polystomum]|nr:kinase-like domain-containing protein [Zopfochytrium polystomum]